MLDAAGAAARDSAARQGAARGDAVRESAARDDAARDDAARQGAARQGAARQGAARESAVPEDAVPEDAVPEDAVPEDAVPEDAVREDAVREDALREVQLPDGVVELAGLDRIDYREAFAFDTAVRRTPEAWERLILAGAPLSDRITMVTCWTALGIRLALPGTSGQVLGWRILHSDAESIVLGARAAVGLTARIVLRSSSGTVVHAMLIRCDSRLAARIWHALAPKHRKFIAALLIRASGHTG